LAGPSDALLDQPAAQIGVNYSALGPFDHLSQACVGYPLASRKTDDPPGLEDPHGPAL
jgi:hypothetical protein